MQRCQHTVFHLPSTKAQLAKIKHQLAKFLSQELVELTVCQHIRVTC